MVSLTQELSELFEVTYWYVVGVRQRPMANECVVTCSGRSELEPHMLISTSS